MSSAVRDQLLGGYHQIADAECRPGMPRKQMDDIVRRALGGDYPLWRIRAIRLGEAGCFSAAAYHGWLDAVRAWEERRQARAAAAAQTEQVRRSAHSRAILERLRDQHAAELARVNARLALMDGDSP